MDYLISRTDAIEAVCMNECGGCRPNDCGAYSDTSCGIVKALFALPLAEAEEYEDYEHATLVDIKEPLRASSEATCATCADRAMCIMSAPDGNWKACKDYRAEAVQGCDGCRYNTRIPQEQCLRCKRYWKDSYERKGGEESEVDE